MNYASIDHIPLIVQDYIKTVSGISDVTQIAVNDINDFLRLVESNDRGSQKQVDQSCSHSL